MASGRPTLFVGPEHCESADTDPRGRLRPRRSAWATSTAWSPPSKRLAADPDLAPRRWATAARAAFLDSHEKDTCCARWGWMIGGLVGAHRPGVPFPAFIRAARGAAAHGSYH